MRNSVFAIFLAWSAATSNVQARAYDMVGFGAESCEVFLGNYKNETYASGVASWVSGFVTGFNASNRVQNLAVFDVSSLTPDVIVATILVGCSKDKSKTVFEAATAVLADLPLMQPTPQ